MDLMTYKYSINTKLCHLVYGKFEWKLVNPWGDKKKSWTQFPFSFHLNNTRNKKIKPQIHLASLFFPATPGTKTRTHLLGR